MDDNYQKCPDFFILIKNLITMLLLFFQVVFPFCIGYFCKRFPELILLMLMMLVSVLILSLFLYTGTTGLLIYTIATDKPGDFVTNFILSFVMYWVGNMTCSQVNKPFGTKEN